MIKKLALIIVLALPLVASSQSTQRFYNIARRDGLASGSITAIIQDNKGLIWLGTKKGLSRYDGTEFVHFHAGNSGITSNDISSLTVDSLGNLWIGTYDEGLHKLNLATEQIYKVEGSQIGNTILATLLKSSSSLWVLSKKGLHEVNQGKITTHHNINKSLKDRGSTLAKIDSSIIIGTNDGELIELEPSGNTTNYSLKKYKSNLYIQKIYSINENKLLIGTRQQGLLELNSSTDSIRKVAIDAIDIRAITKDKTGAIWVGTDGQGIYRITENSIQNFVNQPSQLQSLVSNAVQVCFEDRDDNMWFGTSWDGVSVLDHRLDDLQFYYSDFKGFDRSGVLDIYKDNDRLWFGTDGSGLSSNTDNDGILEAIPASAYVQFIDKFDNRYWVGTFQSGFYIIEHFESTKVLHFNSKNGLVHDNVRQILPLADDNYLIATWGGGLTIFNAKSGSFKNLPLEKDSPKDVVTLHRISDDEVLIGTFGQGLFLLNISNYSYKRVLNNLQNIVSINHLEKGIWIGTWGQGLHLTNYRFSESKIITSESLNNKSNIVSIQSVKQLNETWIASSERIFKINENEEVMEIPVPNQQYHLNSSLVDDNQLYFGGTDGVICFRPDKIQLTTPRSIEILDIKVLNKKIEEYITESSEIILNHDQNMLTINYTTPNYPVSENQIYEVRLDPIQKNWINVGTQRAMTFADLNPGSYQFKVRNATSKFEKEVYFTILNPWWKTWWAYTLASLLFLALLYFFRKFAVKLERIKNQLQIEKIAREKNVEINNIKQQFFVNVSHEIRTPLTLILGEIDQLTQKLSSSKAIANSLNSLRNNSNHLFHLVNELLDFRKLDQSGIKLKVAQGNFVNFSREIFLSFINKAESQSIDYKFICEKENIKLWYDRDQLEKVFYNLLSNAFKHTPKGGSIKFTIEDTPLELLVNVKDTGLGISKKDQKEVFKRFYQKQDNHSYSQGGYGIGLSIVQEISELHHGYVSLQSKKNEGSCFTICLKKGKSHFKEEEIISSFINSESLEGYQQTPVTASETIVKTKKEDQLLIVEDNTEIRNYLVNFLSEEFKILEATNGKEGYQIVQDQLPDLIISDVMMPEMDGISLTQQLKKNPLTSHIPIILLTARTTTVFKKEGFEMGADDYVTKPFDPSLLMVRINNLLKSREILRQQISNQLATRPDDLNLTSPDEQFLKDLVSVIEKHLDNSELNAELVSSEMGMSHSVIYKKIKALSGYNLVEFIRDFRLQHAAQMLKKYKFSIAESCYRVGFSDKKYFSQIFKKKFGVSPSEYSKSQ